MGCTHSLLEGSGQLHSDFIINLKCERSSFCFLKYNSLSGVHLFLRSRDSMSCENQRSGGQQMKNGTPWQGNCWWLRETFSLLSPHKNKSISEQWNLLLHTLSSPLVWQLLIVWKPFTKEKIQFRGTSPLGCSKGKVCNTIPLWVGRGHLTSKEPAGITKPITSLASGASPRYCCKAVEYLGFVCVFWGECRGSGTL